MPVATVKNGSRGVTESIANVNRRDEKAALAPTGLLMEGDFTHPMCGARSEAVTTEHSSRWTMSDRRQPLVAWSRRYLAA